MEQLINICQNILIVWWALAIILFNIILIHCLLILRKINITVTDFVEKYKFVKWFFVWPFAAILKMLNK